MLKFREFVNEVLDSHYDFQKHDSKNPDSHYYSFNKGSHIVSIQHANHHAHVDFTDREGDVHATGKHPKDAARIMGTVKHIIKHHVSNHPEIKDIKISGLSERGRTKLYRRIAKRHGGTSSSVGNMHTIPVSGLHK